MYDELVFHVDCPPRILFSPAMVFVVDVPFFEFDHNFFMNFVGHLLVRLACIYFISEFDESVEVICLLRGHPVTTIYQGSFYHFEFLTTDQTKVGIYVFDNEVL
jgi:hypothetical protein